MFCFTAILNTNIFKQSMRQTNGCMQVLENQSVQPHGAYKLEERVHRGKHVVTYLTKASNSSREPVDPVAAASLSVPM